MHYSYTRSTDEIKEDILDYFRTHQDEWTTCIEDLDRFSGYLGFDRYYPMDEFADFNGGMDPAEAHGYDLEGAADFSPNRKYFAMTVRGKFVSANSRNYSDYLDIEAVEAMLEGRTAIDGIDENEELDDLFEELAEATAREEEETL